jgi:ferredoxin
LELNGKTVLVCDCNGTMRVDGDALAKACGMREGRVSSALCRAQIGAFEAATAKDQPVLVACTQEAPLFTEARAAIGRDIDLHFTNIRERAGWSEEGERAMPKIAALLAEAALEIPPTPAVTLKSAGTTLIYGRDEIAIAAAQQLAGRLDCTLLLDRPVDVVPPRLTEVPIFSGTVAAAKGHLGAFEIVVNRYAAALPSSRRFLEFERPRDGAASRCDLILDLTGGTPLFPAHQKRDGYFRPDPRDPAAVQKALFDLTEMVGEFEKPRYVKYEESLCAHGRNTRTGCTRCLDVCPTGAITSAGDKVVIDPYTCAGCGSCASVCPTGASTYALPPRETVFERLRTLLSVYAKAGGTQPVLLIHDSRHGEELIALMARHGRGLPARVLPFAVNETTQLGLDFFATAFAYGAAAIRLMVDPKKRDELAGLAGQLGLTEAALGGLGFGEGRVGIIDALDPDVIEAELYGLPAQNAPRAGDFLPMGGKRGVTMLALRHLRNVAPQPAEILPLPAGAPFGTLDVDAAGCTLCLSCVSACPTGALIDNPDWPMLRFTEDACVQCGLCKVTCPEKVIALKPRLNFSDEARSLVLIKEEDPAHCIRCGKPFGTRGAIEAVIAKLAGKHWMFQEGGAVERIRMCEDCRLVMQAERSIDPFAGPPKPTTRTTEDYLRERERASQRPDGKLHS